MSVIIPEAELAQELTAEQAVEAAYAPELAEVASRLQRALPCLIECDKELAPFLYLNVRNRLRAHNLRCLYLDGRPRADEQPGAMPMGMMGTMIAQLREAVRGAVERRVVVLPHLDLLTTSQGGLTAEAREVIPLLYENPELVWLGFKDPSFPLPRVIESLFPHRISLLGISRNRLRHLITQREGRKFGREFNPWQLYKHVSGINAVRLRRLLSTLEGEDFPADPRRAYRQLRQATLTGTLEVPNIDLDRDIGGYATVKKQLRSEIIDVLSRRDHMLDADEISRIEELIPRGMIFWGPPGTGKTLFAKGMAAALGAAITVVSGPELKSKWVGESLPWDEEVPVVVNGQFRRMPIGELVDGHRPGDEVWTWSASDEGAARFMPVNGFIRHDGPGYIDVLTTETGRCVRVTGGHSLFVNQEGKLGEVFAEQVEPGVTRIAVPLRLTAPETVRELHTEALLGEPARTDPASGTAVKVGRPAKALPAVIPLTEELGEFLGMWTADGCYVKKGVRLTIHENELSHFEAICNRLFGHATVYRKKIGGQGVDLIISHANLRRLMEDGLGMKSGSRNKRVPVVIFLAPTRVAAAFLRGYFQGDGTFSGKYVEASTVSKGLADDVATLLQYFGIAARLRRKPERTGSTSYRIRFLWTRFLRTFLDEIGFVEARRNDAIRNYLDGIRLKRDKQTPDGHITNDVLWDKVVSKTREPYSRQHVYDLSVPGTERFIAGSGNVLVHNSEDNLRQIFHRARQSAPSIIVFDELDSFASARGTYTGSGVEHSMVNQLLTEMDGFRKEELVFVIGTTNFVEILDPALLRPGRFEFHLHIPYPDNDDRRDILKIYDKKMKLQMTDEALEYAVRRTGRGYTTPTGTPFSGDHLNALCRALARLRIRDARTDASTPADVEKALTEWIDRPKLTTAEERVLATHEAGHAVVSLFCPHAPPIERITIESENPWAFGYVSHQDPAHRFIQTRNFYLDAICVALGAREAECLLLDDLSMGAVQDLQTATSIARDLVEVHGMGGPEVGIARYRADDNNDRRRHDLSETQKETIDRAIHEILETERQRATQILRDNKPMLEMLRDLLLEKKTLEAKTLKELVTSDTKEEGRKSREKARKSKESAVKG